MILSHSAEAFLLVVLNWFIIPVLVTAMSAASPTSTQPSRDGPSPDTTYNSPDCRAPMRNQLCCGRSGNDVTTQLDGQKDVMSVKFVSDLAQSLKWTSTFLIYDSEHENLVSMLTSDFSANMTKIVYQLVLADMECTDTYIKSAILDAIKTSDTLDAVLVCSLPCILRVLETALSLEKEFKRRLSVVQSTKWLLVPSGDEDAAMFDRIFSLGFDNIAVVSRPLLLSNHFSDTQDLECSPLVVSTLLWKEDKRRELSPVGHYCPDQGAVILSDIFPNAKLGFNGRHFIVSTMLWDPYMMRNVTNGSYHYYGYTLIEPADQMWGHNNSGEWSGLVGQLHRQEVDLTMAPLAMSKEREAVMDFTFPFYHDFSGVLLKRPDPNATKWRVYIDIFRWEVLLCLAVAMLCGSVIGVCIDVGEGMIVGKCSVWLSLNRCWVLLGALLAQGCRRLPKRGSGRMFLSAWWLFSIVMAATYSGNLIAFLTVTKDKAPFDTLEEMVRQDQYTYGTIDQSMWTMLFEFSSTPTYRAIHENIQRFSRQDSRVLDMDPYVHLQMVREGGYAYIADTGLFNNWLATNCDLMLIKEKFYPSKIMQISESGLLQVWIKRWWPKRSFCAGSLTTEARALNLMDTQSVFYLAGVGMGLSAFVLLVEWLYHYSATRCCPAALTDKKIP
ncbi:hypothetical protein BaRGS_00005998 [Batillaria attramentaria]|uniref:Uncharacterized protein n=1 Tax=Batillaria attramentaria TaxID=370345 RepID=A0ABD0LTP8_9CAEN